MLIVIACIRLHARAAKTHGLLYTPRCILVLYVLSDTNAHEMACAHLCIVCFIIAFPRVHFNKEFLKGDLSTSYSRFMHMQGPGSFIFAGEMRRTPQVRRKSALMRRSSSSLSGGLVIAKLPLEKFLGKRGWSDPSE